MTCVSKLSCNYDLVSHNYEIILLVFCFLKNFISRNYDIVSCNYDLGVLVFGF